ncbi:MAG: class I SAM-dependent methyltransferase [Armatimonadota bacterium]
MDPGTAGIRQFVAQTALLVPENALLLDAGAGEGRYRGFFPHARYVGADFAKGDAGWDYSRLDVVCDLLRLPFKSNCFDAALCTQVLEHVPEPSDVLKEIARCLKPGAVLILTAPLTGEEHQRPYDFYRYTSFGLKYLLEKAEFRVERLEKLGGHLHFLAVVLPRLNNFLWPRWARVFLFPIYILSKLMLGAVAPLLMYHLDRYDREKDLALNFGVVARKSKESAG